MAGAVPGRRRGRTGRTRAQLRALRPTRPRRSGGPGQGGAGVRRRHRRPQPLPVRLAASWQRGAQQRQLRPPPTPAASGRLQLALSAGAGRFVPGLGHQQLPLSGAAGTGQTSPAAALATPTEGRPSSIVGSVTVQAPGATEAGGAMANPDVFTMVLAGGEGKRLAPLTADRAKPAVAFAGDYRLVDFVLSNLVNGGYTRIAVLTQYKSHSLDRHVTTTWRLSPLLGGYVTPVPAQMRRGPRWFAGSADAIFQSLNLVYDERPEYVIVFGADHVYRMDPRQMVAQHVDSGAGVTVAGIRVPIGDANQFGVIETAPDGRRISAFREKPSDPQGLPDAPDQVFASMGNYVFRADTLIEAVSLDAKDEDSQQDLGGNIIPMLVGSQEAEVYDFADNDVPGATDRDRGYWRDVGTLDAYYDAHMDLISVHPVFNLYNYKWPILTWLDPLPPAKFVFEDGERRGQALD